MSAFNSRFRASILLAIVALMNSSALGEDMDKRLASEMGLRGSVKQCVEQTTYSYPGVNPPPQTTTYIFALDGKLLQTRTVMSSGPDLIVNYTYDGSRLRKMSYGPEGGEQRETAYEYDAGTKSQVERLPIFESRPNTAIASAPWEGSDLHFQRTSGGTLTTIYDDRDLPIEGQMKDEAGRLIVRILRKYDSKNRIINDQLIPVETPRMHDVLPDMNEAQKAVFAQFMHRAFASGHANYDYDTRGHLIAKHITDIMGVQLVELKYNDQGDVVEEKTTTTPSELRSKEFTLDDAGNVHPIENSKVAAVPPSQSEVRYTYEYDSQGNWTQRTMLTRVELGAELAPGMVTRRTLTYY